MSLLHNQAYAFWATAPHPAQRKRYYPGTATILTTAGLIAILFVLILSGNTSQAATTGRAPALSKGWVPNVSIGGVVLGSKTVAAVKAKLGSGVAVSPAEDQVSKQLVNGQIVVRLFQGQVIEIETDSPDFVAGNGLHVGSAASAVRAAFGGALKATTSSLYLVGRSTVQGSPVHTYFDLDKAGTKVVSIRIGYYPWLTPCYGGPTLVTTAIADNQTWGLRGCPYIIENSIGINKAASLTIQAGVVVKFSTASAALVASGGALIAQGTADSPVVFTSINDQTHGAIGKITGVAAKPGDWQGLVIDGNGGTLKLEHVALYYGGSQTYYPGGVYVDGGGNPEVTIQDSVVAYNKGYGINASRAPAGTLIRRTEFFANDAPLALSGAMSLDASNTFAPVGHPHNIQNGIFLPSGVQIAPNSSTVVWAETHVPFVIQSRGTVVSGGVLHISRGVIVKFFDSRSALGVDGGVLQVQGTASQPVIFTSFADDKHGGDTNGDKSATAPKPGDWDSVYTTGNGATMTLSHAAFFYGGSKDNGGNQELYIAGSGVQKIDVEDSLFALSAGWGIDAGVAPPTTKIEGSTFYGDAAPLHLGVGISLDNSNSFTGPEINKQNGIFLIAGYTLNSGLVTLAATEVPFVFQNQFAAAQGGNIVLGPGVTLKAFDGNSYFRAAGGVIQVNGTAAHPVILTSFADDKHGGDTNGDGSATAPKPGDWRGVEILSQSSQIKATHMEVFYGGSTNGYGAGLYIDGSASQAVDLGDCVFALNKGWGVDAGRALPDPATVLHGNAFYGNDYPLQLAGNITVDNSNTFHGPIPNGKNAIYLLNGLTLSSGTTTLAVTEVPYVTQRTTVQQGATLVINPGVTVKGYDANSVLYINGGNLQINGTAAQPVILTSLSDTAHGGIGTGAAALAGDWSGLYINGAARASITYAQVFYGGSNGDIHIDDPAAVTIANSEVAFGLADGITSGSLHPVSITNTKAHDNKGFGINFVSTAAQAAATVSGNTASNNGKGDLGINDQIPPTPTPKS